MASIISFTFREAVADVEYKGKRSSKNYFMKLKKKIKEQNPLSQRICNSDGVVNIVRHWP